MSMILILRAIFGAIVCGDFLLAFLILLLLKPRPEETEAEETRGLSDNDEDARRVREVKEDAEAWKKLQSYSVRDAYGGDAP